MREADPRAIDDETVTATSFASNRFFLSDGRNSYAPYNHARHNNLIMLYVPRDRAEFNRVRSQPVFDVQNVRGY